MSDRYLVAACITSGCLFFAIECKWAYLPIAPKSINVIPKKKKKKKKERDCTEFFGLLVFGFVLFRFYSFFFFFFFLVCLFDLLTCLLIHFIPKVRRLNHCSVSPDL